MTFEGYEKYLESLSLKPSTVRMYSNRLRRALGDSIDQENLILKIDVLMFEHSKYGSAYRPEDHGKTMAALRHLKYMITEPYAQQTWMAYNAGVSGYSVEEEHVQSYRIENDTVTVEYYAGSTPTRMVVKKIPHFTFLGLVGLMLNYRHILGQSNTAVGAVDGHPTGISYRLDDNTAGTNCRRLFMSKTLHRDAKAAKDLITFWLAPHVEW